MSADEEYKKSQARRRAKHIDFDVETWYPMLFTPESGEETFESLFIRMTLFQAQSIVAVYQHCFNHRDRPSDAQIESLKELTKEIRDTLMEKGGKWFVRLSTRSPKDAIIPDHKVYLEIAAKLRDAFRWELQLVEGATLPEDYDTNVKMTALSAALSHNSVETAEEVMTLLCTSERVFVDLLTATHAENLFATNPISIILRRWEERLEHDMEFRGFVSNGKLNALSQYNHYCYFPTVVQQKEEIQEKVIKYWSDCIQDIVVMESYVVDFAVLKDGSVKVIELNPFAETTGGSLFEWRIDREVLENGPFEFRVHEEPVPELKDFVDHCVDTAFGENQKTPEFLLELTTPNDVGAGCTLL